jgi:formate hydrogenlyase subunit 3/multisubunit Na+/H+ antiporter MnhD subunit
MNARLFEPLLLLATSVAVLMVVLGFVLPMGIPILGIGIAVVTGWFNVLSRVAPRIEINIVGVATAVVCIAATIGVLHLIASWWYRHVQGTNAWRWRWTMALVAAVCLMFIAGLVGVGLFRTTSWFVATPEMIQNANRLRCALARRRASAKPQAANLRFPCRDAHSP